MPVGLSMISDPIGGHAALSQGGLRLPREAPSQTAREIRPAISVIVPLWNDWPALARLLRGLDPFPDDVELIVAVARSPVNDSGCAESRRVTIIACSQPNRGAQLNAGAAIAQGDLLLFHHADSLLSHAHLDALRTAMRRAGYIGGAFHRKFDDRLPIMKCVEPLERWRCVHGRALFGDQSIFVRRDVFNTLGGYAEIPLMEDFEFSRRLRRAGTLDILDPPMLTSARHHEARGAWRTSLRNLLFLVLYQCGVSPWRLHRWYYGEVRPPSRSGDPLVAPCPIGKGSVVAPSVPHVQVTTRVE